MFERERVPETTRIPIRARLKKALALASGLAVVAASLLIASPAQAHTGDITATAECNESTWEFDVTYTLTTKNTPTDLTGTVKTHKGGNSFSNGWSEGTFTWEEGPFSINPNGTHVWHDSLPGNTVNGPWVYSFVRWSNNVTVKSDTRVEGLNGDCEPNHDPEEIDLCHWRSSSQVWETRQEDSDEVENSDHNEDHSLDIIPAFDYWVEDDDEWTQVHFPGKNLNTVFSGFTGSQILAAGCAIRVTPTPPTFAPAVCTAPGVVGQGSYTIPSQTGVSFQVKLNNTGSYVTKAAGQYFVPVGTFIQVKAIGLPSWVGLNGTKEWSYTVASPGDCIVETTPVAPTVTPITECGMYGSVVLPTTTGVVYQLTSGNGLEGPYTVTATPAAGYEFIGPQSVEFSGDLGEYTDCVTPTEPTFTPSECVGEGEQTGGSYTIPTTEGVQYQVKIGDGPYADVAAGVYPVSTFPTTITVKALAEDGYTLDDYTGPWSHTFVSAGECLTEAFPVGPQVTIITECDMYGSVVIPETTGVVYELTQGDGMQGLYTVTATPAEGYFFDDVESVEYSGDLGEYTQCVTPLEPTFTDSECVEEDPQIDGALTVMAAFVQSGYFTIPSIAGVQYTVSIDGGPFVDYAAGDYNVPDGTEIVVKATVLPGYTLEGQTEWSHTFGELGECELPTFAEVFAAASATGESCEADGTIDVVPAEHVLYYIDGVLVTQAHTPKAPGTYLVQAKTDSIEYAILGQSVWELEIGAAAGPCDLTTLALTGQAPSFLGLSIGGGLLFLGAAGFYMRRRFGVTAE